MPLPDDFYDENANYIVRLCMLVDDTFDVSPGSAIHQCDSCGKLVWVDEHQEVPPLPDGLVANGSLNVCRECMPVISKNNPFGSTEILNNIPPELQQIVRKFFGMDSP